MINNIAEDGKIILNRDDDYFDFIKKIALRKNINIISFSTFNIDQDEDIASVDPEYLLETLIKLNVSDADALFISCTALPALEILEKVEKKVKKLVLSSNQTLIWDTLRSVGYKSPIQGYGKLLRN